MLRRIYSLGINAGKKIKPTVLNVFWSVGSNYSQFRLLPHFNFQKKGCKHQNLSDFDLTPTVLQSVNAYLQVIY